MSYSLVTAVLVGLLVVLGIMLRGLYVMETQPDTEAEARVKLDSTKHSLRETLCRVIPWRSD